MGDICNVWTFKPTLSLVIILVSMTCMVQCTGTSASIGDTYPRGNRGNHWAVGHLMGKKSLDSLSESVESEQGRDYQNYSEPEDEEERTARYQLPSKLYGTLLGALLGQEEQRRTPPRLALLWRGRQLEEQGRDRRLQQATGLLLQALNNSSS